MTSSRSPDPHHAWQSVPPEGVPPCGAAAKEEGPWRNPSSGNRGAERSLRSLLEQVRVSPDDLVGTGSSSPSWTTRYPSSVIATKPCSGVAVFFAVAIAAAYVEKFDRRKASATSTPDPTRKCM